MRPLVVTSQRKIVNSLKNNSYGNDFLDLSLKPIAIAAIYLYDHPTGDKEIAGRGQQCIISKVAIISKVSLSPAAVSTISDN